MTRKQIDSLIANGEIPGNSGEPALIETHISWVILCDRLVYKIKRPIFYSFLDFSTLEKRKHYCEREILLNQRLTENIYLDVQPVREKDGQMYIGGEEGEITDYAVKMKRLDSSRQMDTLLLQQKVTDEDIRSLAEKIAAFHQKTTIIYQKDFLDVQSKFIDIGTESEYLGLQAGSECSHIIKHAITASNSFMKKHHALLASRLQAGFFRDCHGDLHSRNIFLLETPQPFDCLEFNDDLRQIDVLNEIAFLCMDLDSFGRQDLAGLFIKYYNELFPTMKTSDDQLLFIYYKSYRANIRAKVNSLRARSARDSTERLNALTESRKYLQLMNSYINSLL